MRHSNDDLTLLSAKFKTDKWGGHWYTPHYHRHFQHLRLKRFSMLEIGIGGYEIAANGGESLRMWKEYFPLAKIVGLDCFDKSPHNEDRIVTVCGDQTDENLLMRVNEEHGPFDIIIDDGSHLNAHVLKSFEIMFPLLNADGIYVVEDTQTAYWKGWGGHPKETNRLDTSLGFIKSLTDGLNYSEIPDPDFRQTYATQNIIGIHFYHNLVIIDKGRNDEDSKIVKGNQPNEITG